jgi:hypothetical protein
MPFGVLHEIQTMPQIVHELNFITVQLVFTHIAKKTGVSLACPAAAL